MRRGNRRDIGKCDRRTPQGLTGTWEHAKCDKGEGFTVIGSRNILRHAARVAFTSGGGWRLEGAGDVQVGGASHKDRRLKAVTNR